MIKNYPLPFLRKQTLLGASAPLLALLSGCAVPLDSEEVMQTEFALVDAGVTFQTVTNSRFLGAQNGGGGVINATATAAQGWETFALDDLNAGSLMSGDVVTVRTQSGRYLRAANGGGSTLDALATTPQGWEQFVVVRAAGSGQVQNGDVVGLRAATGTYVRAQNGGGSTVDVRGASLGGWEQFRIAGLTSSGGSVCTSGIAGDGVCCLSACGTCGGSGCGDRPGGAEACCTGPIKESGVSCSGNAAPCVLGGGSTPPPPPPPPPPSGNELIRATFQGQAVGTYSRSDVSADFKSSPSWDNGLSQGRARIVQEGSSKFLRVTYPAGQYGTANGGVQFEVDLKGSYQELYLSYKVRFASNFDFVLGGKLPGFVGGSAPSGCTTDLTEGFSARNMWRSGGKVDQYMYYPDRVNRCGDDWFYTIGGSQVSFQRGKWHTIEHRIVMGTAGQSNGILQAWFDGKRALDRTLKWKVGGKTYGIDGLYFSTFFGGSNSDWAPASAQTADFDDFIVSDSPITH